MSSNQKIEQQTIDKIYHVYEEKEVVAHNITREDLEKIYDPEIHEYEELELNKNTEGSY
jgi:uncharacterized protein YbjQ (UPF0145 family)